MNVWRDAARDLTGAKGKQILFINAYKSEKIGIEDLLNIYKAEIETQL